MKTQTISGNNILYKHVLATRHNILFNNNQNENLIKDKWCQENRLLFKESPFVCYAYCVLPNKRRERRKDPSVDLATGIPIYTSLCI